MKRTKGILGFVMVACLLEGLAGCGGQAASGSSGIGSSADSLAEQAGGGARAGGRPGGAGRAGGGRAGRGRGAGGWGGQQRSRGGGAGRFPGCLAPPPRRRR